MINWNVDPEIITIGPVVLRWYSLMFMISFTLGIFLFQKIFKWEDKPEKDLENLFMYVFFGTIIGARLGHCFFYEPVYYLQNPLEVLMIWQGGLASHGAAIAILISLYLYSRKRPSQPYIWLVDRVVVGIAYAGGFIRLGNLANSEILGTPTDVPWAFRFVRVDNIPRHPAQLYEAICYFLIFFLLWKIYMKYKTETPRGLLLGLFLSLIFFTRFLIEFVKEDQSLFEAGMFLNMGQLLSIPLILLGVYFIFRSQKGDMEASR